MKINAETIDSLAGEYVVGTLTGPARRRFERYAQTNRDAMEAIWRWEQYLNVHTETLEPQAPPNEIWQNLEQLIDPSPTTSRWRIATFGWPVLSGILALLLVVVLLPPATQESVAPDPQLALFQDTAAQPLWVVSLDIKSGQLRTRAINAPALDLDQAFELWMLVDGTPRSLGLLPVSNQPSVQTISPVLLALFEQSSGLAISLEPASGSPTGAPTGPVLYQAPVISL